jgi:hypothetical protein
LWVTFFSLLWIEWKRKMSHCRNSSKIE